MEKAFEAIRLFDWLTLVAIFMGPVLAVFVTRWVDQRRENRSRRLDLFKTLMRTRSARLNPEHVGALNLIEIEYYKDKRVLGALESYFKHLNDVRPDADKWLVKADNLLTKLLYEVAKSLGYEIEQLQILTGGYAPSGWQEVEQRQTDTQRMLLSLLKGDIALTVRPHVGAANTNTSAAAPQGFEVPPGYPPPPV